MNLKKLVKFVTDEDKRMKKYYVPLDKEKKILVRTVKLMEEAGELCSEILASNSLQRKEKNAQHDKRSLSWEFADVFIVLALLADSMGVDIDEAVRTKLIKIEQRHKKEASEKRRKTKTTYK